MNTLAKRLKEARTDKKLTQKELAKRASCSQGTIGNVESGIRDTLPNVATVAYVLEINAFWLETGKGVKHLDNKFQLTEEEKELITLFRKLTPNGKKIELMSISSIAEIHKENSSILKIGKKN